MSQLHEEKQLVRQRTRLSRTAKSTEHRRSLTRALTRQLISFVSESAAQTIACYSALPSEPDTAPFLDWARSEGIRVLLPRAQSDGTLAWAEGALQPGAFGILEPTGEALPPSVVAAVDVMLIPASAVDERGIRVGWGKGFYDRCLADLDPRPTVYAVVFDDEIAAQVPRESHDIPVDGVVTELRRISFLG